MEASFLRGLLAVEIISQHARVTYNQGSYFYVGLIISEVHYRVGILTKPLRIISKGGVIERGAYYRRVPITVGSL